MSNIARPVVLTALVFFGAAPAFAQPWPTYDIQRAGFLDALHTSASGSRNAVAVAINADGVAIGWSDQFNGNVGAGNSGWVWDAAHGPTRIGLYDAEHTSPNQQITYPTAVAGNGRVIGYSIRYTGGSGQSAWTWARESGTVRLGYTGPEYTSSGGVPLKSSTAVAANAVGQVIGTSIYYTGNSASGSNAWLWTAASGLLSIGPADAMYTGPSGRPSHSVGAINDVGQVIGLSARYSSGVAAGQSAWIWSQSAGLTFVGFTDAAHTRSDGVQSSSLNRINTAGAVVGSSARYSGIADFGRDAWVRSPAGVLTEIGLTSPEHTRADGFRDSRPERLNENGFVAGSSIRYLGTTDVGYSSWYWSPATGTVQIDLPTTGYTRTDGTRNIRTLAMNAAGATVGSAARYAGSADAGQGAWVYDPAAGTTHALVFSARTSDGYVYTQANGILDNGVVFGRYTYFANGQGSGEDRAFLWRADTGMTDLGLLVAGGLAAQGWTSLRSVVPTKGPQALLGYGAVTGEGTFQAAFVLVPRPCRADLASLGGSPTPDGQLTPDDLIAFLDAFFAGNRFIADLASLGGNLTPDGQLTPDDLIAFLTAFFAGCP